MNPAPLRINVDVIENPKEAPISSAPTLTLPTKPAPAKPEIKSNERAVFGLSKNSLTDTSSEKEGSAVAIKEGNTVAIAQDDKVLKPGDAASLPIPTEEYLVTKMPVLRSEIRVPYPPEAKNAGVEGPVVMDLLVDVEGAVRDVRMVEGPGYGLNEAAVNAAKELRFSPAFVKDQKVAVRIRYIYRFVLEK